MTDLEKIIKKLIDQDKTDQQRYQVIDVLVPNATLADTLNEFNTTLDKDFNKIKGIAYFQITDGGQANNYNVGARTSRQTWVDPILITSWIAGDAGPMDKFRKVNISYGQGDKFYTQIVPLGNLASDLTGQMVLLLERDNTVLPK